MQNPRLEQFPHRCGHAAGAVKTLAEIGPGRLHVDEQRQVVAVLLPDFLFKLHAGMPGHGDYVRLGIGRTADHAGHRDGVFECFAR